MWERSRIVATKFSILKCVCTCTYRRPDRFKYSNTLDKQISFILKYGNRDTYVRSTHSLTQICFHSRLVLYDRFSWKVYRVRLLWRNTQISASGNYILSAILFSALLLRVCVWHEKNCTFVFMTFCLLIKIEKKWSWVCW